MFVETTLAEEILLFKPSINWFTNILKMVKRMNFDDIYCFFRNPPPLYLNQELAVCYILDNLLQGDSYGTELIARLERESSTYRLSDTVLYSAIKFLEGSGTIAGYWKKVEGRGRPRRMYRIEPDWLAKAKEFAYFWSQYSHANSAQVTDSSSFANRAV
jgi:DNA-binding PadR family transcriptional regulator